MTSDLSVSHKRLSVLFLCRKYYFLHKMSRVRFHAAKAIGALSDMTWSGPEWDNWKSASNAEENILRLYSGKPGPDIVLCYKPQEIAGFANISFPTALNRDEMFTDEIPAEQTAQRIIENKIDLVISHQKKQLEHPLFTTLPCHFAYIPYCADTAIFKDYKQEKRIDLLLIGNLAGARYPLRAKLQEFLLKMRTDSDFIGKNIFVYPYPGYRLKDASNDLHVIDYASLISQAKICLTCCGKFKLKYAKYVEVPACRTLLMGDMPQEDQEILKEYLVVIEEDITYKSLKEKVLYYLEQEQERQEITDRGWRIVNESFTQTQYGEKFIGIVKEYLSCHGPCKVWA